MSLYRRSIVVLNDTFAADTPHYFIDPLNMEGLIG